MDDWLSISGFDAWSAKLQELMGESEAAAASQDNGRITIVAERLRKFRRYSPIPSCDELDKLANTALAGLVRSVVSDSLQVLGEASAELDGLVKRLRIITSESNRRAGWLSLKTPTAIVGRLDDTAEAFSALYETTKDLDNADEIKSRIDSAVRAVARLREEVQKAV